MMAGCDLFGCCKDIRQGAAPEAEVALDVGEWRSMEFRKGCWRG